jgi:hypothetical protein
MPDAHARPARSSQEPGTGTPSLIYGCHSRRAFRYPAHTANVADCRMFFVLSNRSGWRMILGAGSGIETSSLRSSSGKDRQPRLHRADASPKAFGASIGTVLPAPWPDSDRAHPRNTSRMSRGFARHEQAIARDASHGQDTAIRREAPPVVEDEQ